MLSDRDIRPAIESGDLVVDPLDPERLQPASVDVHLGRSFRVFTGHRHGCIDPTDMAYDLTELVSPKDGEPFVLHPGEFALGGTRERVKVSPSLALRLEGRSSLGRLGLLVHSTAGFVDPGFEGRITLELSNISRLPILLWPGMGIGQLCVFRLSSPAERPYGSPGLGSRYQGQDGPTASIRPTRG